MSDIQTLFVNLYESGGPIVVLLLVFSVIALTVIIAKAVQLYLLEPSEKNSIEAALRLWAQRDTDAAIVKLQKSSSDQTEAIRYAMSSVSSNYPESVVKEESQRLANRYWRRLKGKLSILETIASVSPLLGLFGTVLGMIEAFRAMEQAGSQVDPSVLSGGIWQALLTTGVGLAVAIPSVLAFQWLDRKATNKFEHFEDQITRVFTQR